MSRERDACQEQAGERRCLQTRLRRGSEANDRNGEREEDAPQPDLTKARLEQKGLQDGQIGSTACVSGHRASDTLEPEDGGDDRRYGGKPKGGPQPLSAVVIVRSARQRDAKGTRTEHEDTSR